MFLCPPGLFLNARCNAAFSVLFSFDLTQSSGRLVPPPAAIASDIILWLMDDFSHFLPPLMLKHHDGQLVELDNHYN